MNYTNKKLQDIENRNYILTLQNNQINSIFENSNLDTENHVINQNNMVEKKKSKKEIYGKGYEANAIKKELGDFNLFESDAYKRIISQFGKSIRFNELLGIVNSINTYLIIKQRISLPNITRNEKRSFPLLIKYIERNSELIYPYLQYISLCNSSFQKILLDI